MHKPDITVGATTIGDVVDILAENFSEHLGLEYHSLDIRKNFRQLREQFDAVAKGLMALGIAKGDKVAIWANNIPEWVYTQYGSARTGAADAAAGARRRGDRRRRVFSGPRSVGSRRSRSRRPARWSARR